MMLDKGLFPSSFRPLSLPSFLTSHAARPPPPPPPDARPTKADVLSPSLPPALPPPLPPALRTALYGPSLATLSLLHGEGGREEGQEGGKEKETPPNRNPQDREEGSIGYTRPLPPAVPALCLQPSTSLVMRRKEEGREGRREGGQGGQAQIHTPSRSKSSGSGVPFLPPLPPSLPPPIHALGRSRSEGTSKTPERKKEGGTEGGKEGGQKDGKTGSGTTTTSSSSSSSSSNSNDTQVAPPPAPSGLAKALQQEKEGVREGGQGAAAVPSPYRLLQSSPAALREAMKAHDDAVFRPPPPRPLSHTTSIGGGGGGSSNSKRQQQQQQQQQQLVSE